MDDINYIWKPDKMECRWFIYLIPTSWYKPQPLVTLGVYISFLFLWMLFFFFFFLNVCIFLSSNSFSQWLRWVDYGEFIASYWDAVNKTLIAGDQRSIQCYILTQTRSHTFPHATSVSGWKNIVAEKIFLSN